MQSFFGKTVVVLLGFALFIVFLVHTGKMSGITETFGEVAGIAVSADPQAVDTAKKAITEAKIPTSVEVHSKVSATAALARLTQLDTTPGPVGGYAASKFGKRWLDVNRNGCSTRVDILARDLDPAVTDGCAVKSGHLNDPYTGTSITLAADGSNIAVDRFVSLPDAWQSGAAAWNAVHLAEFANDPLNLIAVDAATAEARAGATADVWTPPNTAFQCDFIAAQVNVKSKYKLTVTVPEATRAADILNACAAGK